MSSYKQSAMTLTVCRNWYVPCVCLSPPKENHTLKKKQIRHAYDQFHIINRILACFLHLRLHTGIKYEYFSFLMDFFLSLFLFVNSQLNESSKLIVLENKAKQANRKSRKPKNQQQKLQNQRTKNRNSKKTKITNTEQKKNGLNFMLLYSFLSNVSVFLSLRFHSYFLIFFLFCRQR